MRQLNKRDQNAPCIDVGDTFDVKIEGIGREGDGIARIDGFVVFIPDVPLRVGDSVTIRITKVSRRFAFAVMILELLHINIISDAAFKVGKWEKLHATVMNVGNRIAKNIKISLSGPFDIHSVRSIPMLESKENKEVILGIKPIEHGNLPLDVSISYRNEDDTPLGINDVAYINVAKENEKVSMQPQSIFNIGSIGEVLGEGATKVGDVGMIKGGISSTEKPFSKCPYCGEVLNLPKTPKFCPHCGEQLR